MLFNSYLFLGGFLPIVLAGYGVACRVGRMAVISWLVVMSLIFYSWWNISFLPVLLTSIAFNFVASRLILMTRGRKRSLLLGVAVGGNLVALFWFKYLAAILRLLDPRSVAVDPILPLGISFFTFTQIGYLLDCHSGLEQRRPLPDYLLFVTFFPHLISGPILNGRELFPALAASAMWRPRAENIAIGGGLFLIGLLKKTLFADPLAALVAPGFTAPETLPMVLAWRSALAWPLQLYFDFSGYSDMAVGLARMFGIAFPCNFDSPYKAASVIDYWQRWHISLTRFLMSTVHAPLTMAIMRWRRARGLKGRAFWLTTALPILVTMGLAGVWHGAGLTFAVFGLLHAMFLVVNHAWRIWGPKRISVHPLGHGTSVLLTFLCVVAGAIIFRAPSLSVAWTLFVSLGGGNGIGTFADRRLIVDLLWLAGLLGIVWGAPSSNAIMAHAPHAIANHRISWAAAYGAAATLGVLSIGGTVEFLYFQF